MLIVIVVIGILASLAVISVKNVRDRAKDIRRVSDIKQLRTALELYNEQNGRYPDNLVDLKDGGTVFMNRIPDNPDSGVYGPDDSCTGGTYVYSHHGNTFEISYCLAGKVSEIPAGWCIATPDTMCSPPPPPSPFGSGEDGDVVVGAGPYNINSDISRIAGRSCSDGGDAVNYAVISIDNASKKVTVNMSVGTGCLNIGDEVLIIDLQGALGDYGSVGNYEFAKVASTNGSDIFLESGLSKTYGSNIANQKILIQRVPHYNNLTVNDTLTANPWNSAGWPANRGGVVAFRVGKKTDGTGGVLGGSGSINMSGKGYVGGVDGHTPSNTASEPGEGLIGRWTGPSACTNQENIGGGGGGHRGYYYGGDGGGGGAHADFGFSGTNDTDGGSNGSWGCTCNFAGHNIGNCSRTLGIGGDAYPFDQNNLNTIFMGSGGGAGGGWCSYCGSGQWGDGGGNGGGIIMIMADTVSGSLNIKADGGSATNNGHMVGGGGGAGGSVLVKAKTISNTTILNSNFGSGTGGGLSTYYGGNGGNGSVGRIAVYDCDNYFGGYGSPAAYHETLINPDCSAPVNYLSQCKFTPGPIAQWKFEGDYSNSGSMSLGTPSTNNITYSTGKLGQAAVFGAGGFNSYINYGDVLDMSTGSRSITFWVKTSSLNTGLISKSRAASNTAGRWYLVFNTFDGNQTEYAAQFGATTILQRGGKYQNQNDNNWHFISVVWNRNGSMSYYLDGVLKNEVSISGYSSSNVDSTDPFLLGAYPNTDGSCCLAGYYLNGLMDEVQIYDYALTSNQINYLYNAYNLSTPCP